MRPIPALSLAFAVAAGVRVVRKSNSGPSTLSAATPPDASGKWTAMSPPGLFSTTELSFVAPGGKETVFDLQFEDSVGPEGDNAITALHGSDGSSEMSAVLQADKTIAGSIVDPIEGMVHQFIGEEGGDLTFTSVPSDSFPDEDEPEDDGPEDDGPEDDGSEDESSDDDVSSSNIDTIDVMVLWSGAAQNKAGGSSKMKATVNLAIQETNQAYKASNINAKLRLVHSYLDSRHKERGFSRDLSDLKAGNIAGVHSKRSQYKADVVALIVANSSSCGRAYIGPSKGSMFSVTAVGCATGYYSFGHEIGHNLGCHHDRGAKNACSSSKDNYGYRDPEGHWRDTLSYACKADDCLRQRVRGRCTRMKFYSNPNVKYQGKASGWKGKADLAKQINKVKRTVSRYY